MQAAAASTDVAVVAFSIDTPTGGAAGADSAATPRRHTKKESSTNLIISRSLSRFSMVLLLQDIYYIEQTHPRRAGACTTRHSSIARFGEG